MGENDLAQGLPFAESENFGRLVLSFINREHSAAEDLGKISTIIKDKAKTGRDEAVHDQILSDHRYLRQAEAEEQQLQQ
ncbi:hypothetical protein D3C75_644610 [compost metagenome]